MSSVLCPTHNTVCRRVGVGSKGFFICKQSGCKFVQKSNSQDTPPPTQPSPDPIPSPAQTPLPSLPPTTTNITHDPLPTMNTTTISTATTSTSTSITSRYFATPPIDAQSNSTPDQTHPQEPQKKRIKLSQLKLSRPANLPVPNATSTLKKQTNDTPPSVVTTNSFPTHPLNTVSDSPAITTHPPSSTYSNVSSLKDSSNSKSNTTPTTTSKDSKPTNIKAEIKPKSNPPKNIKPQSSVKPNAIIPPSMSPSLPTTSTKLTTSTNQSPKKTPILEMKKNAAVLSASPIGKKANPIDDDSNDGSDFKTPPKNIKSTKPSTTTDSTSTSNSNSTDDSNNNKGKKMLSLDILSGKGNQTKKPEAKPKLTIIRPPGKEQPLEKVVVDLQVCGPEHVGTTKKVKNKEVEDVFMSIPGNKMDHSNFLWSFPMNQHGPLMNKLRQIGATAKPVPKEVLTSLKEAKERDTAASDDTNDFTDLPPKLFAGLLGFQIEGLMFAARNGGRCLIADEMGLGKTIQALAVASCYKSEWPLLIICPSSMRSSWKDEIEKWLGIYDPQVKVINNGKDKLTGLVNIISYELAVRAEEDLIAKGFKVVICDESHYMKSMQADRTQVLVPIIQQTPRAILLTGTPALSRPSELFPQLLALGKQMFASFKQYAMRYCAAYKGKFGWDYSGNSHLQELHVILSQTVMIRRLKADVLSDLPNKHRSTITIEISDEDSQAMSATLAEAKKLGTIAKQGKNRWAEQDKKQLITQLYTETARAKVQNVCQYILDVIDQEPNRKFLVFAHHKEMLDGIESVLVGKKITHMRIDGATSPSARSDNVRYFQTFKKPQVAILSMTAAGTGLTLNAASLVIFTELYWTPGVLRQCEDRVHRIGQKEDCDIRYLVAKNTLDENIWPLICHKLEVIGETLDGQEEVLETTEMDYIQTSIKPSELADDPIADDLLTAVLDDYVPSAYSTSPKTSTTTTSTYRSSSPSSPLTSPFDLDLGTKSKPKTKTKPTKTKGKEKEKNDVDLDNDKGKGKAKGKSKGKEKEEKKKTEKKAKGKEQKRKRGGNDDWGFDDIPVMSNKNPTRRGTHFMDSLDVGFDDAPTVSKKTTKGKTNVQTIPFDGVEDIEDSEDDGRGFKRSRY